MTDDAAARLAAVRLGFRVHGTIGILLRGVRRQQYTRTEMGEILRNLPSRSTLHIRLNLLEEAIQQLENE